MKRIRLTYHTLHFLKTADPKLRKAIIANCNQETLKSICECTLNVLRDNIPLKGCNKRNWRNIRIFFEWPQLMAFLSPRIEILRVRGPDFCSLCYLLYYQILPDLYSACVNATWNYLVSPEQLQKCKFATKQEQSQSPRKGENIRRNRRRNMLTGVR